MVPVRRPVPPVCEGQPSSRGCSSAAAHCESPDGRACRAQRRNGAHRREVPAGDSRRQCRGRPTAMHRHESCSQGQRRVPPGGDRGLPLPPPWPPRPSKHQAAPCSRTLATRRPRWSCTPNVRERGHCHSSGRLQTREPRAPAEALGRPPLRRSCNERRASRTRRSASEWWLERAIR